MLRHSVALCVNVPVTFTISRSGSPPPIPIPIPMPCAKLDVENPQQRAAAVAARVVFLVSIIVTRVLSYFVNLVCDLIAFIFKKMRIGIGSVDIDRFPRFFVIHRIRDPDSYLERVIVEARESFLEARFCAQR